MNARKEWSALFGTIPLVLLGVLFFGLPLVYSSVTTDAFLLPKQLLLSAVVTISLFALCMQMVIDGKVRLRTTPFDKPLLFFAIVACISALLAVNRYDSLIAFVPFLHAVILYFLVVNVVRGEKAMLFVLSCLIAGTAVTALLSVLGFFHIYALPFAYAKSPYFTPMGTLFDQVLYFAFVLPIAGFFTTLLITRLFSKNRTALFADQKGITNDAKTIGFTVGSVVIAVGLGVTLYHLLTTQKPLILPFSSGFQIAFAAISQDSGRLLQSFLFGSGIGTFMSDFTRFKSLTYNADQTLWSITFLRSSSYLLELLATTGLLGALTFLYIGFKFIKERTFFLPVALGLIAAVLFPFSPLLVALFFGLLGIHAASKSQSAAKGYDELELHLVATEEHHVHNGVRVQTLGRFMPLVIFAVIVGAVGYVGYHTTLYAVSDMTFQRSLVAASQNNGALTYDLQRQAITQFPYRDSYHRVFSQTNLALANALAAQVPAGSSPSAQVQQNVLTLIQQSITTARTASAVSPYSAVNWNNLSSIYRSLINFGQNADQFSVLTNQQAILLDPNNPQQYVNLGGIYYQLGLWDDAARQFQTAINLKSDYPNAYYNLGHAFESKGDVQRALLAYQIVKQLVANDKTNSEAITKEIDALTKKVANAQQQQQVAGASTTPENVSPTPKPVTSPEPLKVDRPAAQLPSRNPKATIEGPTVSPLPSPTPNN